MLLTLCLGNILILICVMIHYRINRANTIMYNNILKEKEDVLIEHIHEYNIFVDSFDNFYKNKTYQAGLGFLQLKLYQQELLEVLDPVIDADMVVKLQTNIVEIDDLLKELSFLSKHTIKVRKPSAGKIIDPIYFDETKFSKN